MNWRRIFDLVEEGVGQKHGIKRKNPKNFSPAIYIVTRPSTPFWNRLLNTSICSTHRSQCPAAQRRPCAWWPQSRLSRCAISSRARRYGSCESNSFTLCLCFLSELFPQSFVFAEDSRGPRELLHFCLIEVTVEEIGMITLGSHSFSSLSRLGAGWIYILIKFSSRAGLETVLHRDRNTAPRNPRPTPSLMA